jgi:hypothetical protein
MSTIRPAVHQWTVNSGKWSVKARSPDCFHCAPGEENVLQRTNPFGRPRAGCLGRGLQQSQTQAHTATLSSIGGSAILRHSGILMERLEPLF